MRTSKYQRVYKPKEKQKLICINCNQKFLGGRARKFCSKDCAYEMNLKRAKERYVPYQKWIQKEKVCIECGTDFIQNSHNHEKFCTRECAKINYKIKYREMIGKGRVITYLKLRFEILKRDKFTCQYCGRTPKEDKCKLVIDHIIPRIKDGTTDPINLITSCVECNAGKRDILLENRQLNKIKVKNG